MRCEVGQAVERQLVIRRIVGRITTEIVEERKLCEGRSGEEQDEDDCYYAEAATHGGRGSAL